MSQDDLQRALAELPTIGTRVKSRRSRQIWRFEFAGKAYYLKFYPRRGGRLKRLIRGSPALREFLNLQAMQRAGVPSPRAVAHLTGYCADGVKGDAVILEAIEPAVQLDQHLNMLALDGQPSCHHGVLRGQIIGIVKQLVQARLGHADLHLGNFLLRDGQLFLLDGYALRRSGMRKKDLLLLGQSVSRFATRTDLLRVWDELAGGAMPAKNPVRRRLWRKSLEGATGENRYFGRLAIAGWRGHFFKHHKFPRRTSPASGIDVSLDDWRRQWTPLLEALDADRLEILKRSPSGDVLAGEVTIGGRIVPVVVKRPKHRKWYRYFNEIGRGGRSRRAWLKSWALIARDIPTAWPLLVLEKRKFGYVTNSAIVFERVSGTLLPHVILDALDPCARRNLFFRLGRTLRRIEQQGLHQYDSKSSNWMIQFDEKLGPVPVVIDVDGIRRIVPSLWPIKRLLRSLRELPGYSPEDSKWVCVGYRPFAGLMRSDRVIED